MEEVKLVAENHPVVLISEPIRKGYSKAVIDGLSEVNTPVVSFIDSDGQCHPKDLQNLYEKFDANVIMFTISFMSITFWAGTYRSIIFFLVLLFYLNNDLPKPLVSASLIYQLQFLVIGLMPFNYMFSILMALSKFSVFLFIIYILRKEKLLI